MTRPAPTLPGLVGGQPNVEPWLLVEGGRTTTVKTRYIAAGQQLLRADREQVRPIGDRLADRMLRIARDAMVATSITVLSDYRKGVLAGDLPARLIEAARQAGRKIIVDPKGHDFSIYAGADIVTPNRRELADAMGMPADTEDDIAAAATALRERHGFGAVLVTRAEDGMTLVDAAGVQHFPAEAAEVYDVSGAGDTVVATLAAGLAVACHCQSPVAWPTSLLGSSSAKWAQRLREKPICYPPLHRSGGACARSSTARKPPSRSNAGAIAAGAPASPMAASTCCIQVTCICWNRRAPSATGSWWR